MANVEGKLALEERQNIESRLGNKKAHQPQMR
jgi:hypothetical protein